MPSEKPKQETPKTPPGVVKETLQEMMVRAYKLLKIRGNHLNEARRLEEVINSLEVQIAKREQEESKQEKKDG